MLYLNEQQVLRALTYENTMSAVAQALRIQEGGDFSMPERLSADCGGGNMLILMPASAAGSVSTKILTLFPDNRAHDLPVIQGLVLLCDQQSGEFLALMDGKTVTSMRTAAVTGLSIRYLAKPGTSSVGLVGCGAQGLYQLAFACAVRDIDRITLYDIKRQVLPSFAERLAESIPEIEIRFAESTTELVSASDIVITATTARTPVFEDQPSLFVGKHFVAIGSFQPEVREYPDALFRQVAEVWVDTLYACEESGELMIPLQRGLLREEQVRPLGRLLDGQEEPAPGPTGTTFFKTVGMALFDLTTARLIYDRAGELGIGTQL